MKAMKYVGLVSLATVALGFATPVGAEGEDTEISPFKTAVSVNVESDNTLSLVAVPGEYNFTTTIKGTGSYELATSGEESAPLGNITVSKGYTGKIDTNNIKVSLTNLTINRNDVATTDPVTSISFTFGNVTSDLKGTSESGAIYFSDTTFHDGAVQTSGQLSKPVDKVGLNFESTALQVEDVVTGTMEYQVSSLPEPDAD